MLQKTRLVTLAILLVLCSSAIFSANPSEVCLIGDGKANVVIVLPKKVTLTEQLAANEITDYFYRSTGVSINIYKETDSIPSSLVQIHVGRTNNCNLDLKLPVDVLPDEIFIKSNANRIYLVGGGDLGTRFAAYEFLKIFLGIRWFIPTELFEYVPRQKTVSTKMPIDIHKKPAFELRVFGYIWSGENCSYVGKKDAQYGCDLWATRNMLTVDSKGRPFDFSHNLFGIVPPEKYGESHPEYYPLVKGKRVVPTGPVGWQPCTSNPDLVRLSIEAAKDFFTNNPEKDTFSLGINDGGDWCECDACRAMDLTEREFRGRIIRSERYYAYVNQVAKELRKTHPNKYLGTIAYLEVELPPEGFKLEPNVKVYITQDTSQYYDPEYREEDYRMLEKWSKCASYVGKYDYYGLWVLPRYYPNLVQNDLCESKALGVRAYYTEDVPKWLNEGPFLYVASKLMWDPKLNANELIDEFCEKMFGKAAEPMKRYFKILEDTWKKPRKGKWFEGLADILAEANLYDMDIIRQFEECIELALLQANDELAKERISFFAKGLQFTKHYVESNEIMKIKPQKVESEVQIKDILNMAQQLESLNNKRRIFERELLQQKGLAGGTLRWVIDDLGFASWEPYVDVGINNLFEPISNFYLQKPKNEQVNFWQAIIADYSGSKIADYAQVQLIRALGEENLINMVNNASFEEGDLYWDTWTAGVGKFSIDKNVHRTGSASAQLKGMKNGGCFIQGIPIEKGKLYWFRGFMKTDSQNKKGTYIRIRWKDSRGNWTQEGKDVFIRPDYQKNMNEWQELSTFFTPPAGVQYAVILLLGEGHESEEVSSWFEDIVMYEIGDSSQTQEEINVLTKVGPENLVLNSSFEDGFASWDTWAAGAGEFVLDFTNARTGEFSAKISGAKESCYLQRIPVEPGKTYNISCYVRTDSRNRDGTVLVIRRQTLDGKWIDDNEDILVKIKGRIEPEKWYQLSAEFTIPPDVGFCVILLSSKGHEDSFTFSWFDDVSMVEVSKSENKI